MRNIFATIILLLGTFFAVSVRADDPIIGARLTSDRVSLGGSVALQITVRAEKQLVPVLPKVDGLEFNAQGQSVSQQSNYALGSGGFSGSTQVVAVCVYQVTPQREGDFTIPPISVTYDGKTVRTAAPLILHVLKGSGSSLLASGQSSSASASPSGGEGQGDAIFGRITGVPEKMYIGQVVPATVKFYVNPRAGGQIGQTGSLTLANDAFAIQPIKSGDQIHQSEEMIDSVNYVVVSVVLPLTALKEGNFELAAQWPITVLSVESDTNVPDGFGGLLNDPMVRSMFRRRVAKPVTVNSAKLAISVQPLPSEGRPASFSGAIGKFEVKASANPAEVKVGDPLTLKLAVRGSGNFDRINAPELADTKDWKSYPASANFSPADESGISGEKIFTRALIPQNAQDGKLPPVEFSYFDPAEMKYEIIRPQLPPVNLLPADPGAAPQNMPVQHIVRNESGTLSLASIRLEEGAVCAEIKPLTETIWYWSANGASLLLGAAGLFLLRRYRKQVVDVDYQQNKRMGRNIVQSLQALDSALANEDSAGFAEAVSRILRERLAGLWKISAESITTADVRARLGANGEEIAALFESADAVTYAGRRFSRDEMFDLKQRIMEQLKQLEEKA